MNRMIWRPIIIGVMIIGMDLFFSQIICAQNRAAITNFDNIQWTIQWASPLIKINSSSGIPQPLFTALSQNREISLPWNVILEYPSFSYYPYHPYYHFLEFPFYQYPDRENLWLKDYLSEKKVKKKKLPNPAKHTDFIENGISDPAKMELGKLLYFDKILSGNKNISCATCHHPLTNTVDGLSLSVGEGGRGLGLTRDTGSGDDAIVERVPRNATKAFNLGAKEFVLMFHDGRIEMDLLQPSGFKSPAGDDLPLGLENILAAQAMFPVTSQTEMTGQPGENAITSACDKTDFLCVWDELAQRLRDIPEYVVLFQNVFSDVTSAEDITFVHAANAIAAFEAFTWRSDDSPFDKFLKDKKEAMSSAAQHGLELFYGKAGCSNCHSGIFQTDHKFHSIAMPQIGPGKGDGPDGHDDYGRERVTGNQADRYKFSTPSLRNAALTAPYGHDGAYDTLESIILHHLNPVASLNNYDKGQAVLPSRPDLDVIDFIVHEDPVRRKAIADANELDPIYLSDKEVRYLIEFINALTDPRNLDLRKDVPKSVPSGLPLFD